MYAHFGLTFSAFGTLEHGLSNLLAVRLTDADARPDQGRFDHHLGNCFQLTLGNLIKGLESFYPGAEIIGELGSIKAQRDYLAHHFFREKATEMFSVEGMKALLLELAKIRAEIERLNSRTEALVDAFAERMGLSVDDFRHIVEARCQDLVRDAQRRDAGPRTVDPEDH